MTNQEIRQQNPFRTMNFFSLGTERLLIDNPQIEKIMMVMGGFAAIRSLRNSMGVYIERGGTQQGCDDAGLLQNLA